MAKKDTGAPNVPGHAARTQEGRLRMNCKKNKRRSCMRSAAQARVVQSSRRVLSDISFFQVEMRHSENRSADSG